MRLLRLLLVLAPLVSGTFLQARGKQRSTQTTQHCVTSYSTQKVLHIKTTTITTTKTHTWTRTTTATPYRTVNPNRSTITTTLTTTTTATSTFPQGTDTTTVTLTETDIAIATATAVSISVSTIISASITTSSETTIIGTVTGFTPVASLPSVVQNGGGTEVRRRNTLRRIQQRGSLNPGKSMFSNLRLTCPARFPARVTCYKTIETYVFTTKTATAATSTVTAPGRTPSTVTTTETRTSISTVTPADITVTASSTVTSTTTVTSIVSVSISIISTTRTTTSTAFAAIATQYSACAPDNLINAVGNTLLDNASASDFMSNTPTDNDPVACCNVCQGTPNCAGFVLNNFAGYSCVLIGTGGGTCDPAISYWAFLGNTGNNQVVVGDGPCGQGAYS